MNYIKSNKILLLVTFLFLSLVANNVLKILFNCFHATDFSIFQQAIYDIAYNRNINPYLTVRDINIFSDHFDPVQILAIPFAAISNYHPVSLILFEFLWFLGMFLVIWNYYKDKDEVERNYALLLLILTRPILDGLGYPIHPTTWTILPAFLILKYFKENNEKMLLLTSFFFCFFKEIFPISILGLSFFYLLKGKNKKMFFYLFLISSFVLIFDFKIRPIFFPSTINYNSLVINQSSNLFQQIIGKIKAFHHFDFIKTFYSTLTLTLYLFIKKTKRKEDTSIFLASFLLFIPLFLLHYFSNLLFFHRASTFGAYLIGTIIFCDGLSLLNKKEIFFFIFLFIGNSSGFYTKVFKTITFNDSKSCEINSIKYSAIKEIIKVTNGFPDSADILSTGGVIPRILRPNSKYYQLGAWSKNLKNYDYLILELNKSANVWPHNPDEINLMKEKCLNVNPILINEYFLVQKGPFSIECLNLVLRQLI